MAPLQLARFANSQFVAWDMLTPQERNFLTRAAPRLPKPQQREVWFASNISVAINDADGNCLQCLSMDAVPNNPQLPLRRPSGSQWVPWSKTDEYLKLGARVIPPTLDANPGPMVIPIPNSALETPTVPVPGAALK